MDDLVTAKRKAKASRVHADWQREIVAALIVTGRDTADAERILSALEQTQNNHLLEMMRALNALDETPPGVDKAARRIA